MTRVALIVVALVAATLVARADEPAKRRRNVPAQAFGSQKIAGDDPHLPDAVKAQHPGATLSWIGKVCVREDGVVDEVKVIAGIPAADEGIMSTLQTWKLKPQPVPICGIVRFMFDIPPPPKK